MEPRRRGASFRPHPEERREATRLEGRGRPIACVAAATTHYQDNDDACSKCRLGRGTRPTIMDGAFLYILRCADGSYYTGTTRDELERRIAEHNSAHYGGFTATR